MIQTVIKACKPGVDKVAYLNKLHDQARQLASSGDEDGDRPESATAFPVTPENFEHVWENGDEEFDAENKERYRTYMQEGRMFAVEVDW